MQRANDKSFHILLVDDIQEDVLLTRQCFKHSDLSINLSHVNDGEACLSYLRKEGEFQSASTPDLVLLDLNMPGLTGHEVLAEMMKDEELKQLRVVILTTSSDRKDIDTAYRLGCTSYVVKPVDFNEFQFAVRSIIDFWFRISSLPRQC